jgi:hypothetical protein
VLYHVPGTTEKALEMIGQPASGKAWEKRSNCSGCTRLYLLKQSNPQKVPSPGKFFDFELGALVTAIYAAAGV